MCVMAGYRPDFDDRFVLLILAVLLVPLVFLALLVLLVLRCFSKDLLVKLLLV